MLTWALVWFANGNKDYQVNGLGFLIAVVGDVSIFYFISEAFKHAHQ